LTSILDVQDSKWLRHITHNYSDMSPFQ